MILVLQNTTFDYTGGIPSYNRLICRALNEFEDVEEKHILIAMDGAESLTTEAVAHPSLRIESFNGNKMNFVRRAVSLVRNNSIDLILLAHVNYILIGFFLKRFQPTLRYGPALHGIEAWSRLSGLRRHALQKADFAVSVSEYTKRQAVRLNNLLPDSIHVLPNSISWKTTECGASDLISKKPHGIRLLSVGRLDASEQRKGVDTVIMALPLVAATIPDIQYCVAGTGDDLERHAQLARKLGVADHVQFLGCVDDAVLRSLYRTCDVFVLPSAQEGFGIVYLEAMQYAKPVIAANTGGSPEVIVSGETGELIEYGNVQQLADRIINLCLNAEERARLGQAGFKRFQDHFSYHTFRDNFFQVLRAEINHRQGNSLSNNGVT